MSPDDTREISKPEVTKELPRTVAVRNTRRVVFGTLGTLMIAAGLALIVFPGPFTIPLILIGLTILSWEFHWAKRLLARLKAQIRKVRRR